MYGVIFRYSFIAVLYNFLNITEKQYNIKTTLIIENIL